MPPTIVSITFQVIYWADTDPAKLILFCSGLNSNCDNGNSPRLIASQGGLWESPVLPFEFKPSGF